MTFWKRVVSCLLKRDVGSTPDEPDDGAGGNTRVLWTTLRVSKVFGCFPAKNLFLNRKRPLRMPWMSWEVVWSLSLLVFITYFIYQSQEAYITVGTGLFGNYSTNAFLGIMAAAVSTAHIWINFFNMMIYCAQLCALVHDLTLLDRRLRHIGVRLPNGVREEMTRPMWAYSGLLAMHFVSNSVFLTLNSGLWQDKSTVVYLLLVSFLEGLFHGLPAFTIYSMAQVLDTRFAMVKKHLQDQSQVSASETDLVGKEELESCFAVYMDLRKMVRSLSRIFGAYLVVMYGLFVFMIVVFTFWTIQLFGSENMSGHLDFAFTMLCSTVLIIIHMLVFTIGLSDIPHQAEELRDSLVKMKLLQNQDPIKTRAEVLLDSMYTSPVEITAADFFSINRRLVTNITGAVTTYLVVVMQFRVGESGRDSAGHSQYNDTDHTSHVPVTLAYATANQNML